MATRPQIPPPATTLDPRSLWALRIAMLVCTLPLCVVVVLVARFHVPGLRNPCADDPAPLLGIVIPLTLPFLYIMFRLRLRGQPVKSGWARALVICTVWFVIFMILDAIAIPGLLKSRRSADEAAAVGSLRTINTSELTYAETYKAGYSPALGALGGGWKSERPAGTPRSASAAGLIDSVLATGRRWSYVFSYTPGPRNATGEITSYTITARPSCKGWISFYTDESGIIRATGEDRPATAKDPPLQG